MNHHSAQLTEGSRSVETTNCARSRKGLGHTARVLESLALAGLLAAGTAAGAVSAAPATVASAKPSMIASTTPANKDQNPYGIAVVPSSVGNLVQGDILVSNFNNAKNLAGTGSTIVQVSPDGKQSLFASVDPASVSNAGNSHMYCPGGVGLTTALSVFQRGYVVVGSLPTSDGMPATARAGCLIVLDSMGHVVRTITKPDINGPWDMTSIDQGNSATLFVTNVLNGTVAAGDHGTNQGTVVRLKLSLPVQGQGTPGVLANTIIASGFAEKADPNALVIGPTGLGLGKDGTLYVADTLENRIAAIPDALTRTTDAFAGRDLTAGEAINAPLGLAVAANGNILSVNGGDGNLVETTPTGTQVMTATLNMTGTPPGAGALFGLAVAPNGGVYFDDSTLSALLLLPVTGATHAVATLQAQAGSGVNGTATLLYNAQDGMIDVTIRATGLAPNSVHPVHIHQGASCDAKGPVIFPLPNLHADAQGDVMARATIKAQSIPAGSWYINIHAGLGQEASLTCGLVTPSM